MTNLTRIFSAAALIAVPVVLVGAPSSAIADANMACPRGFAAEPSTVFSSNHRARLTNGKLKNGKACLRVIKPGSQGCGTQYKQEFAYVFAGAHLPRLTGNGSKIRAGRVCIGLQRPGSTVWDPVSKNPAEDTIRTRNYAMHRNNTGYANPYRTINNTSKIACQAQCQIRARCKEYDYNKVSKKCQLWEVASTRPIYDKDMIAGLKSKKTNVQYMAQPEAARQFATQRNSVSSGVSELKHFNVPNWEICTRRCIDEPYGACKVATMRPGGGTYICTLYPGSGSRSSAHQPSGRWNSYLYGRKRGKGHDK